MRGTAKKKSEAQKNGLNITSTLFGGHDVTKHTDLHDSQQVLFGEQVPAEPDAHHVLVRVVRLLQDVWSTARPELVEARVRELLRQLGVKVVSDLPGVGEEYQDHYTTLSSKHLHKLMMYLR